MRAQQRGWLFPHSNKDHEIGVLDIGSYLRDVCRDLSASASGCTVEIAAADGIASRRIGVFHSP
jgi:hypothetical protein